MPFNIRYEFELEDKVMIANGNNAGSLAEIKQYMVLQNKPAYLVMFSGIQNQVLEIDLKRPEECLTPSLGEVWRHSKGTKVLIIDVGKEVIFQVSGEEQPRSMSHEAFITNYKYHKKAPIIR